MTDVQQFELLDMLNEMYYSQSKKFREQYKHTYIALHDHICQPQIVTVDTYQNAAQQMERLLAQDRELRREQ